MTAWLACAIGLAESGVWLDLRSTFVTLNVNIERPMPGVAQLTLSGQLDADGAQELDRKLERLGESVVAVVLDLRALDSVEEKQMPVLYALWLEQRKRAGRLCLVQPQPAIESALRALTALPEVRIFREDRELQDYLAGLHSPGPY